MAKRQPINFTGICESDDYHLLTIFEEILLNLNSDNFQNTLEFVQKHYIRVGCHTFCLLISNCIISRPKKTFIYFSLMKKIEIFGFDLNKQAFRDIEDHLTKRTVSFISYESSMDRAYYNFGFLNKFFSKSLKNKTELFFKNNVISVIYHDHKDQLVELYQDPFFDINNKIHFSEIKFGFFLTKSNAWGTKDKIKNKLKYVEIAALFGSPKCFNFLIMNTQKLPKNLVKLAIIGGNIDIIHKLERYKIQFNKSAIDMAAIYHHEEVFEWLYEAKGCKFDLDINMIDLLTKFCCYKIFKFLALRQKAYSSYSFFSNLFYSFNFIIIDLIKQYYYKELFTLYIDQTIYENFNRNPGSIFSAYIGKEKTKYIKTIVRESGYNINQGVQYIATRDTMIKESVFRYMLYDKRVNEITDQFVLLYSCLKKRRKYILIFFGNNSPHNKKNSFLGQALNHKEGKCQTLFSNLNITKDNICECMTMIIFHLIGIDFNSIIFENILKYEIKNFLKNHSNLANQSNVRESLY